MSPSAETGLPKGVAARFEPDLVPPEPVPRRSYEVSLSAETSSRLQSNNEVNRTSHYQHVFIAALRILHFRYSATENAYVASCLAKDAPDPLSVSLPIDAAMPLQQAVEMVKVMTAEAESERERDGARDSTHAELLVEFAEVEAKQKPKSDNFDMVWRFFGTTRCEITYNVALYSTDAIRSFAVNFTDVLEAVLHTPQMPVADVEFGNALDHLRQLNVPLKQPWPQLMPNGLAEAFEQVVRLHSSDAALVQQRWYFTYKEIDILSSILADRLQAEVNRSGSSSDRIAVCIPPSALAIITILAIVKTGCAYVPLDVRHPPGRIHMILEDSGPSTLVIADTSPDYLLKGDQSVPCIDITGFLDNWKELIAHPPTPGERAPRTANKIACLLYTSGTTGKPKGVRVTQRGIIALATNKDGLPFVSGNRVAQVNNLAWDGHIIDIWLSFLSGSMLFSFSRFEVLDAGLLTGLFQLADIGSCMLPTALFRHILASSPELLKNLRHLLVGGEALHFESVNEARAVNPNLKITNLYGPTEACTFATTFIIGPELPSEGPVPIGNPVNTARIQVVDARGRLVPPGVVGEVLIGGDGVADGYHNQPDEVGKAFFEMEIAGVDASPSKFYRTGDRARWRFDGQLEFLGRASSGQIKIRGQRLELTEVEAAIVRETGVKDAGVVFHKSDDCVAGALLTYVVPQQDPEETKNLEKNSVIADMWAEHYDELYSDDAVKLRKAFIGWDSMITGQPIPHNEMQDWLKDTLRPFHDCSPQRVFEVGCGVGIILYEMVPFVDHFYALEPSGEGVDRLKSQLGEDGFSGKVSLWHSSADKVHQLPDFQADFMLINSVAQYFPSEDYLRDSLLKLVERTNPGGRIMLGDIRSAPFDDFLATDIIMEQWKDDLNTRTIKDLLDRISQRRQHRAELLLDPTFFFDLQRQEPRITHVEIKPKLMSQSNELSRYRYQVILHVLGNQACVGPDSWVSSNAQDHGFSALPQLLDEFAKGSESMLAIERIPNKFLGWQEEVIEAVSAPSTDHYSTLSTLPTPDRESNGWSAFDLDRLARSYGLVVQLSVARQVESTSIDAVFTKPVSSEPPLIQFKMAALGSIPGFQAHRVKQIKQEPKRLRNMRFTDELKAMKASLPAHMMPDSLLAIEWLPLTSNGKLDRHMLAEMAASDYRRGSDRTQETTTVEAPRDELERAVCDLFSEVLSVSPVSLSTDFFDQGGHSLTATWLRSAVERTFKVPFPLPEIFHGPTPEHISAKVKELQATGETVVTQLDKQDLSGELADLSYAQARLWFLDQLTPGGVEYNSPYVLHFTGDFDEDAMEKSVDEIVRRHDILRTIFVEYNGVPKSKVVDIYPKLEKLILNPDSSREEVSKVVRDHAMRPFDLSREPAFKPALFRWGPEDHILCLSMHHIITDGHSHNLVRKEVDEIYTAFVEGKPHSLPDIPIRYKDFAQWQRGPEFEEVLKSQEGYWISHLRGTKPARLPADHERTSASQNESGTFTFSCGAELKEKLWAICQRERVTWFMLLISAFRAVHFQWTGASDASLGSPIANRHREEVEQMLGFFVNTQVFRILVRQGQPFSDVLRKTREQSLDAFQRQDVPFDRLVQALRPRRKVLQNPLVEMMFAFQTYNLSPFSVPGLQVNWFDLESSTVRFDLETHWSEQPGKLECVFHYRKAIFEESTIARLATDIQAMLGLIAENPDIEMMSNKHDLDQDNDTVYEEAALHTVDPDGYIDGPPENEIEEQVCLTFGEVLGVPSITRGSDFFDNGGHSLLVSRACSQLRRFYKVPVEIRDVFQSPTPAGLAKHIEGLCAEQTPKSPVCHGSSTQISPATTSDSDTEDSSPSNGSASPVPGSVAPPHYVFTNMPNKPYIFCTAPSLGISTIYATLSRASDEFNIVGVNDPALSDLNNNPAVVDDTSTRNFGDLAKEYYGRILELERQLYPETMANNANARPLNLLGYSFGGNVAMEVARQARQDGRPVVNLFVVDSARSEMVELVEQYGLELMQPHLEKTIDVVAGRELQTNGLSSRSSDDTGMPEAVMETALARNKANLRGFYLHSMAYPGHVTHLRSQDNLTSGIAARVESVDEVCLPGSHYGLLENQTEAIMAKVSQVIAAAAKG